MKKITGLAVCAVLIALCLSSCNYDNKSAVREKETTETTSVQTTAVQTTEQPTTQIPTELKAEVSVPSETQPQINEDRSDPDDPNDDDEERPVTGFEQNFEIVVNDWTMVLVGDGEGNITI